MDDIDLNIDLEAVAELPVSILKRYYTRLYEQTARYSNKDFYVMRVSYRLQELRFGGLSTVSKGFIRKMYEAPEPKRRLFPIDTVLVRTYKGNPYRVKILKQGGEMDGIVYNSLTAVAYKITGRHMSGRQFFGVK